MPLQATHAETGAPPTSAAPVWGSVCHINYTRDTWVKLLHLPNAYSFNEAKLLCQASADLWVAWVPDHGELVLSRGEFYC